MICLIIYLALSFIGLGVALAKHGEPRGDYNFWHTLIAFLIEIGLLYGAGLFKNFDL